MKFFLSHSYLCNKVDYTVLAASCTMMGLSAILIVIISAFCPPSWRGWIAVACASFIFGSTVIPMKSPSLASIQLDPLLFSVYNSLGIFLSSMIIFAYVAIFDQFNFQVWAILGAFDINLITYFAFLAIQHLGASTAPAIWCGVGMTTAFIWGAVLFGENVNNVIGATFSIISLILGVLLVSWSKTVSLEVTECSSLESVLDDNKNDMYTNKIEIEQSYDKALNIQNFHFMNLDNHKITSFIRGFIYCLLTGIFDGSLMVSYKLSLPPHDSIQHELFHNLSYIVCFGIASIIISPIMFLFIYFIINRNKSFPNFHLKVALFPGILCGGLWSCANIMSMQATFYLVSIFFSYDVYFKKFYDILLSYYF